MASSTETPTEAADAFNGGVVRVVDGDTLWIDGQSGRIRIWGLNAPETDAPGGAAAMAGLVEGRRLTCRHRDTDRFGRIVGQCVLPDAAAAY